MLILETLRDAIQGLIPFIDTRDKIKMANALLKVNFDIFDIGSFVSPRAVQQMKDTDKIINQVDIGETLSKLFVLVVNEKGGKKAAEFEKVSIIGFPFSTSPEFLRRNINSNIEKASETIYDLQNSCDKSGKYLMLYFSMAFGNPYGDSDDPELIYKWVEKFSSWGIKNMSLSDITGVATVGGIKEIYKNLRIEFPDVIRGLHLHIKDNDWHDKVNAAYEEGCTIFDGVISGLGGCPMTGFELLNNLPTSHLVGFAKQNGIKLSIDENKFREAMFEVNQIMKKYL